MHVYGQGIAEWMGEVVLDCAVAVTRKKHAVCSIVYFFHLQESKLNLVEGLQKLLEVNGRKDVIRKDYTT